MNKQRKRRFQVGYLEPVNVPKADADISLLDVRARNAALASSTVPAILIREVPDGSFVPIWVLPGSGAPRADSDFFVDLTVTKGHVPPDSIPPAGTTLEIFAIPDTAVTVPHGNVIFDGIHDTVRITMHATAVTTTTSLEIRASLHGQVVSNEIMVHNNASPIVIQP